MLINATLIGQSIAFFIFIWFCMKYVWPPLVNALEERKKKIADGLAAAERGKHEQELAEQKAKQELQSAKQQASDIIAQAQKRASEIVDEAKTDAREESGRIKAAAEAELDQEINRAKEDLRKQVSALALAGAEQILGAEIDATKHNKVLDDLATQI